MTFCGFLFILVKSKMKIYKYGQIPYINNKFTGDKYYASLAFFSYLLHFYFISIIIFHYFPLCNDFLKYNCFDYLYNLQNQKTYLLFF